MNFTRLFTAHPETVGETYFQHMGSALYFSCCMLLAGTACLLHGVLPFVFSSTGKDTISHLYDRMALNRNKHSSVRPTNEEIHHHSQLGTD
ncbi:MAG: DUF6356 family protein [Pseudomonadota bacterium]